MEVLDNGNHIKDRENQTTSNNYTCRLSKDLNIAGTSVARSKGESDVHLLVACKAQLSSEVIRWKTESLRLQKERDSAHIRMKELDHALGKFSEKTKELEARLLVAEEENKRLRGRIYCSPNISILQKLSMSLDKYHSYPWSENASVPSTTINFFHNSTELKKSSVPQDDWKEVSQKLLEKMKQEMKELQDISYNFTSQESDINEVDNVESEVLAVKENDDKLEEYLSNLITETGSLKQCLLEQRRNLKALVNNLSFGNINYQGEALSKDELKKGFKALQANIDSPNHSAKPKSPMNHPSRHSDDSFRAFFMKHLDCQNIEKMSKTMQLFMQSDSSNIPQANKSPKTSNSKSVNPFLEVDKHSTDKKALEDERVCPICQAPFDKSVPQDKFEKHVVAHLEEESASLLDQYVVV